MVFAILSFNFYEQTDGPCACSQMLHNEYVLFCSNSLNTQRVSLILDITAGDVGQGFVMKMCI